MTKKHFSLGLIVAGAFLLLSILAPIGASQLNFSLRPTLIDPTLVASAPLPIINAVLGTTTADYTQPSSWFPAASFTPTVSKVQYFTLSIPSLKMFDVPVEINGADLKKNPIQFPGTAVPGTYGNTVIFGHSSLPQLYKPDNPITIFNPIVKARIGEEIYVNYDGVNYKYVVRNITEVKPEQIEVLAQRYDKHELTLITCVPLGTYLRRHVLRAELVN